MIRALPEDVSSFPLPYIRRLINEHLTVPWDRQIQRAAIQAGMIRPLAVRSPFGPGLAVDADQARDIIIAATMAETAQIPVIAAMRVMRALETNPELAARIAA